MEEGITFDRKSLKAVLGKTANYKELAKDCVAFANLRGGYIHIGIEDNETFPDVNQRIPENLPGNIVKRINELTVNVALLPSIKTADNGGEYIILQILGSSSSIASTSKGEYLIRDGDKSRPVMPDELTRLFTDKPAFCWETKVVQKINWKECDREKLSKFVEDIRNSDSRRVSKFVKEKTEYEILEHYLMVDETGLLTNLGVLWVGKREHRARLIYSPSVQYIKYDNDGRKVDKRVWDDYSMNPKELIESIWNYIPDWKESYEISEGLWRKQVPAYNERVIREVLCNALAHRPYTTRGDIFINIHPDYMEVVNPGLFPLGITETNLLQKTQQRNEHLSKVFFAIGLIEKEGSGWDLMYEILLSSGRNAPKPFEGDDYVRIVIERKILNHETIRLFEYISDNYEISQKGLIALGIIVQSKKIKATELSRKLQLIDNDRLRSYVAVLQDKRIIISTGRGKGVSYFVNPELFSKARANIQTTLSNIEPHRLKALILEDLRYHPNSLISEVSNRLPDVDYEYLAKTIRQMALNKEVVFEGGRKYRKYRNCD